MNLIETLGYPGRMISGSKSGYSRLNPNNFVIFNSNLCIDGIKAWYGDIDLTLDQEKISSLSKMLGKKIQVLYEMDGRFSNEEKPLVEKAAVTFFPDGKTKIREDLSKYYDETMQLREELKISRNA